MAIKREPTKAPSQPSEQEILDRMLDEALKETFPASDPIAILVEELRDYDAGWAKPERA